MHSWKMERITIFSWLWVRVSDTIRKKCTCSRWNATAKYSVSISSRSLQSLCINWWRLNEGNRGWTLRAIKNELSSRWNEWKSLKNAFIIRLRLNTALIRLRVPARRVVGNLFSLCSSLWEFRSWESFEEGGTKAKTDPTTKRDKQGRKIRCVFVPCKAFMKQIQTSLNLIYL